MLSAETEVKVIAKASELADDEKGELLFKAFDLLLSESDSSKSKSKDVQVNEKS